MAITEQEYLSALRSAIADGPLTPSEGQTIVQMTKESGLGADSINRMQQIALQELKAKNIQLGIDFESLRHHLKLERHLESISAIAVDEDQKYLVTASSQDGAVMLWRFPSGEHVAQWSVPKPIGLAFCDAHTLAINCHNQVVVIEIPSGQLLWNSASPTASPIWTIAGIDKSRIIVGCADGSVSIITSYFMGEQLHLCAHIKDVMSVSLSPWDHRYLSTSGCDSKTIVYETWSAKELGLIQSTGEVMRSLVSDEILVTASEEGIRIWKMPTLEPLGTLPESSGYVYSMSLTMDSVYFFAASIGRLQIWHLPTLRRVFDIASSVSSVLVTSDYEYLVSSASRSCSVFKINWREAEAEHSPLSSEIHI